MKIRIKGNSIRFRLTKSEVETFSRTGSFTEKTAFGHISFDYGVQALDNIKELKADFKENTITLYVPKSDSQVWFENDLVGFQNYMKLENGQELFLLLEKDFACLDNTLEDQSDNYPNPMAEC
ncbi:DUF7009 family protein [Flagellimonas myxillae]|uniref:DUF7009 family protein n=1 Tax=Flagellimonas myxillae TaxID=2942214 RepID=UPI00201F4B65|nr:hypothetical protein [Muricauda myxillae]MCL6265433.1 hypothetical protein [Muricauda myxillae]